MRSRITDKEIAEAINKTPSAISYIKRKNPKEYEIVKLGAIAHKLGFTEEQLFYAVTLLKSVGVPG